MTAATIQPRDRLGFTLFVAASAHVAIILGVGFSSDFNYEPSPTIEVTLSMSDDGEAPENADFIAQTNQLGSGDESERTEPTTTERTPFQSNELQDTLQQEALAQDAFQMDNREVLTTEAPAEEQAPVSEEVPLPEDQSLANNTNYQELLREIASLEARIADNKQASAREPRVKRLTSVSAKSAAEAAYLNMWREKVERIGNANFPSGGRFGKLRLLVILQSDGALKSVRILEPSGIDALDEAALRIVRLAAPYQPFPVEMRKKCDRLEIIRTWVFSRTGAAIGR